MSSRSKLETGVIREKLAALQGWSLEEGKLHREYKFDDFVGAFRFMSGVALIAERMNHHPEWFNVYNRVVVDLNTHDVGGISELDFELARAADELA